jgi:hypothetical protein
MYASVIVLLSVLSAGSFILQSDFTDNDTVFMRCEVCHVQNAETTKTSPHNRMACIECHTISGFVNETHNATTPECNSCHEDIIPGLQHTKLSYLPEPYFVYNPEIIYGNSGTYITIIEPVNATLKK